MIFVHTREGAHSLYSCHCNSVGWRPVRFQSRSQQFCSSSSGLPRPPIRVTFCEPMVHSCRAGLHFKNQDERFP